jgi:diacylglycerol kinase family enzyme
VSTVVTRSFAFLVQASFGRGAAGGGAAPAAVVPVARALRDQGASVEVTYSPGPNATRHLVAEAVARGDVVVAVGGDQMICHLAGAVAGLGGTLGIVPAGRGNDFARMLGVGDEPTRQAAALLSGPVRAVDLVTVAQPGVAERLVAGSVYAGVDALAAATVDRARRLPASVHYPYAAVRSLLTYRPARYRLVVDGDVREVDAATVVVANSAYYGRGMRIAPGAVLDDGVLDVVVVGAASRRGLLRHLPLVYAGTHVDLPEVSVLRGRRVELSATTPVPTGGDGEPLAPLGEAPTVVEVRPGALQVIA